MGNRVRHGVGRRGKKQALAEYRKHRHKLIASGLVRTGPLVAVLFLADALVTVFVEPEVFAATTAIRTLVGLYAVAAALVAWREQRAQQAPLLALILSGGVALDVATAARVTGGLESPYFVGQMLVMVGAVLLFPMEWHEILATTLSVWAADLLVSAPGAGPYSAATWATHVMFLLFASMIAGLAGIWGSRLRRREYLGQAALAWEKAKSEGLLLNILPASIAERLKAGEEPIADRIPEVTVLFADIVGFTSFSADRSPSEVVESLDAMFTVFDELISTHGLEKIKTIGDAYMAVAGLPEPGKNHVEAAARTALAMLLKMVELRERAGPDLEIRVGLHTGPVVAGVIGMKRFQYDVWGDTVNVASRMESHGKPGRIQVSSAVRLRLNGQFQFELRGEIEVKNKGKMTTWWLVGEGKEDAPRSDHGIT